MQVTFLFSACYMEKLYSTHSVLCMKPVGNVVIVGTSSEDLYLVRRYGRTLNADLLQRDRSLFTNLLTSGARLIGIAPTPSSDAAVVKLIPVPLSFLLLAVSQKTITAWSDWTNPGEESVVWTQGIRQLLGSDLSSLGGSEGDKVEVVDAALMHVELGAEQATLLVLSAQSTGAGDSSSTALWLHTMEIQITPGAQAGGGHQSPVRILHRMRLSKRATFYSSREGTRPSDYVAPALAAQPPSWRVFIAWTEAPTTSGDDYENADVTLHGVQIDVLNQPLLNATSTITGGQRDQRAQREESIQCRHAQDSKLPVSSVLAVSAVKGVDGLCVVKTGMYCVLWPASPQVMFVTPALAFAQTAASWHLPRRCPLAQAPPSLPPPQCATVTQSLSPRPPPPPLVLLPVPARGRTCARLRCGRRSVCWWAPPSMRYAVLPCSTPVMIFVTVFRMWPHAGPRSGCGHGRALGLHRD